MSEEAPKAKLIKQARPLIVEPLPLQSRSKKKIVIKKKVVLVRPTPKAVIPAQPAATPEPAAKAPPAQKPAPASRPAPSQAPIAAAAPRPAAPRPAAPRPDAAPRPAVAPRPAAASRPAAVPRPAQPADRTAVPRPAQAPRKAPRDERRPGAAPAQGRPVASPVRDPLRRGPVIIRDTNLPPLNFDPNAPVPSAGGPRQVGVVGGRDFTHNRPSAGGYRKFGPGSRPAGGRPGEFHRKPFGSKPPAGGPGSRPPRPFGPKPFGSRPGFGSDRPAGEAAPVGKTKRDYSGKKKTERGGEWEARRDDREAEFSYRRKILRTAAEAVPKTIDILPTITVGELARKMNLKASEIISKCFAQGMMVTINMQIDSDTASLIASDYGCECHIVDLYDETVIPTDDAGAVPEPRAPIVTVMGHVDHGKTKLLDAIRSTHVAESEFGGITQHIGAYKVSLPGRGDVVFLDTPGHAAFTKMRARGAQITDIVVLVVAANDGVMPQTLEAIDHAKAANVPIIVAINKCDLPEAKPDRVLQQLAQHGLTPEEWGGSTLVCRISALKKQGIDELLETILLQAEMLDLKAPRGCRAEGKILESRIDPGKGSVATIMVKRGTLREGDFYVAGVYYGHVRAMFDDRGKRIREAGPSTPVEISGLSGLPNAGDPFQVTENEKQAKTVGTKRQELERLGSAKKAAEQPEQISKRIKDFKEINVIIKGDVQGSVEALKKALEELSTEEVALHAIHASAGAIVENDINLALASENHAVVIGFNVRPTPNALRLAEQGRIDIRKYNVIYDAVDDIKALMEGLLAPERTEVDIGTAEVRQVFVVPKVGPVAGCYVTSGLVRRTSLCRVIRDSVQITKNLVKIASLKRFKDDAKEVAAGYECGIGIEGYDDIKEGDVLEFVEIKETKRTLEDSKGAETKPQ